MPDIQAIVTATFSRRMRIRLPDGSSASARIKGKQLKAVCGDRVVVEILTNEDDWLITAVRDRENELRRPNLRGGVEVLAANIDLVLVVAAAIPRADWFVVDRYLCAAESMRARAAIIFNKTDLGGADSEFAEYEKIGYDTVSCSAATGKNVDQIGALVRQQTAIIVGQSGVGKSSIINSLLGEESLRTAQISGKTSEGRHTTVNSEMLDLPGGGAIIDSPGVRDYAPALRDFSEVMQGFREIASIGQKCRFTNCRHLREPGCAVKDAVSTSIINPRRFESYRRLLALTEKLEQRR
ncbi:MAG: ribosome small subunit-dependent GTPase A [Gammaproteobacteria bacterium]|nr:ribosome small subunit-dependent GTPase A [Gammaproteobacteria bacterium]MDH5302976.1 ribosome small subunit-dependent GTPase A [Gammaproteobacteria bacterium]